MADSTEPLKTQWQNGFPSLSNRPVDRDAGELEAESPDDSSMTPLITVATSLGIVLSLFGGLVWITRKYGGKGSGGSLPGDLIEPLGVTQLDPRTQLRIIRLNRRLVVLSQSSAGLQTICEITDPAEVEDWLGRIQGKSQADFYQTMRELEQESTPGGFADANATTPPRRRGLFAST